VHRSPAGVAGRTGLAEDEAPGFDLADGICRNHDRSPSISVTITCALRLMVERGSSLQGAMVKRIDSAVLSSEAPWTNWPCWTYATPRRTACPPAPCSKRPTWCVLLEFRTADQFQFPKSPGQAGRRGVSPGYPGLQGGPHPDRRRLPGRAVPGWRFAGLALRPSPSLRISPVISRKNGTLFGLRSVKSLYTYRKGVWVNMP